MSSPEKINFTPDSPELESILQETHKETQSLKAQIMFQNIFAPFKIGEDALNYQKFKAYILAIGDKERGDLKNNITKLYRLLNDRFQSTKDDKEKKDILDVTTPIFGITGGRSSEDADKPHEILDKFFNNLLPDRSAIYSALTTIK